MDRQVWGGFAGQRVLLLQGPVGPFFKRVSAALQDAGASSVRKINFVGGDWLYYPSGADNYTGTLAHWPTYLSRYLAEHRIDAIVLFGDCRPVHRAAIQVAAERGLTYWVFEEGYIRPNYVTFERHGVNGYSGLPSDAAHYAALPTTMAPPEQEVGATFGASARMAMAYFTASTLGKPFFPHRLHHRSLNMLEGLVWCRSYARKLIYRSRQAPLLPKLCGAWSKQYFLVGLQTAGDAQVLTHSGFDSVVHFIEEVLSSFAASAPPDVKLVIKHHPMDRGYHDYTALLDRLGQELGIAERLLYVHDLNLPALMTHARGVVVINSTVGLSALHHQTPVITLGKAIYDIPGLTFQGGLHRFWHEADSQTPNLELYWKFRNYVVDNTQLNGSFYKPLPGGDASGLIGQVVASRPPPAPLASVPPAPRPLVAPARAEAQVQS